MLLGVPGGWDNQLSWEPRGVRWHGAAKLARETSSHASNLPRKLPPNALRSIDHRSACFARLIRPACLRWKTQRFRPATQRQPSEASHSPSPPRSASRLHRAAASGDDQSGAAASYVPSGCRSCRTWSSRRARRGSSGGGAAGGAVAAGDLPRVIPSRERPSDRPVRCGWSRPACRWRSGCDRAAV